MPSLRNSLPAAALVSVLVLGAGVSGPARAYYTPTVCSVTLDPVLDPGLSATGSSGTVESSVAPGAVDCDGGTIHGQTVSAPGTFALDGHYGTADPDSCLTGGEGTGLVAFTVPTYGGPQTVTDAVTFTYAPLQDKKVMGGSWQGEATAGTFEISMPTSGECLTGPASRLHVTATFNLFKGA